MNLWDRFHPTWISFNWRLLRFCGIDLSREEVSQRRYTDGNAAAALEPEDKGDATTIEDLVKALYQQERDRREALDKKVSWLLTLTGILIPLSVNLNVASAGNLPRWFHLPALLLVMLPLLLTAVLLLEYLAVGNFSQPSLDKPLLEADEAQRQRLVLKSYLDATSYNQTTNHHLVDLYRAARRTFFTALAAVAVLGIVATAILTWGTSSRLEERLIRKLRADPQMIELLRGPVGKPGLPGQPGPPGPRGERGATGPAASPSAAKPVP